MSASTNNPLTNILAELTFGDPQRYRPHLRTRDVKSVGFRGRIFSSSSLRIAHLLSSLEQWAFMLFDLAPAVQQIREQYPLFPMSETQHIARQLDVRHPTWQGKPVAMTTDLVVTAVVEGCAVLHAFSIKPLVEASNRRVLQKFAIEREFWRQRGIPCHMLTDRDLPQNLVRNIEWLHPFVDRQSVWPMTDEQVSAVEQTIVALAQQMPASLWTLCHTCDELLEFSGEGSRSLATVRYLLASGQWQVRLSEFTLDTPVTLDRMLDSTGFLITPQPSKKRALTGEDHG